MCQMTLQLTFSRPSSGACFLVRPQSLLFSVCILLQGLAVTVRKFFRTIIEQFTNSQTKYLFPYQFPGKEIRDTFVVAPNSSIVNVKLSQLLRHWGKRVQRKPSGKVYPFHFTHIDLITFMIIIEGYMESLNFKKPE